MRFLSLSIVLVLLSATLPAADTDVVHKFNVHIASELANKIGPVEQKVDATADVRYSWKNAGQERVLILDMLGTKATIDGNTALEATMSREKMTTVTGGVAKDVTAADGPEPLRKLLKASFGEPLCKLQLDANGKETKRTIIAQPEAQPIIENGMIANSLLFHPPYYPGKSEWESEREISMGNGGSAKGKLRYKKSEGNTFQISGTLSNDEFKMAGVSLKNAQYVVEGSQTYDPALREWVAGKMKIAVSYELLMDETKLGTAKGTMNVTFERLKPEK